ncbi:hypothetical protein DQG23_05460 [Paenibacillus contaminans]|uniref:Uncharacterized protein n=1 Tax=Paenibacillus contaminans TaxID=450362 RepID=A0A329MS63_9BACL|nr:hypothetical protein DQG23_05460 [Paenibacillus contaminans]
MRIIVSILPFIVKPLRTLTLASRLPGFEQPRVSPHDYNLSNGSNKYFKYIKKCALTHLQRVTDWRIMQTRAYLE